MMHDICSFVFGDNDDAPEISTETFLQSELNRYLRHVTYLDYLRDGHKPPGVTRKGILAHLRRLHQWNSITRINLHYNDLWGHLQPLRDSATDRAHFLRVFGPADNHKLSGEKHYLSTAEPPSKRYEWQRRLLEAEDELPARKL
jgi:hypothetical protein